jgi:hypothetical protein
LDIDLGGKMDPITLAVAGGSILSSLWGGSKDRKVARDQQDLILRQREQSLKFIQDQVAKTQGQLFQLFPQAQASRQQGMDYAANVYGMAMPAQMKAFQQGNVGAQQALLAGLPQQNAALLGMSPGQYMGTDQYKGFSGWTPQKIDDPSLALAGMFNAPQLAPIQQV